MAFDISPQELSQWVAIISAASVGYMSWRREVIQRAKRWTELESDLRLLKQKVTDQSSHTSRTIDEIKECLQSVRRELTQQGKNIASMTAKLNGGYHE